MNTSYALQVLTGMMALFGLNDLCDTGLQPVWLPKTPQRHPGQPAAMNGELFSGHTENPDLVITPGRAPKPDGSPLGVELVGANKQTRMAANDAARLELEGANPNLNVLRGYSGGGGLGESVDAYYTPREIGELMWAMLEPALTFTDKQKTRPRVLDSTCGTGGLLTLAPEELELTGVEFDPVAAAIAQKLMPHAAIYPVPFETFTTRCSEPLFDASLINPPFGPRGLTADLHEPEEKRSERYILRNTIRRVRHGSLTCALLPVSLLHGNSHAEFRRELLNMALPLSMTLVPAGVFKDTGAEVTTAIVLLRRHDLGVEEVLKRYNHQQVAALLRPYAANSAMQSALGEFVGGSSLIKTLTHPDGSVEHTLTCRWNSWRLSSSETVTCGNYKQPIYKGELSRTHVTNAKDAAQTAIKDTTPVTLRGILEAVRFTEGETEYRQAKAAAKEAPNHAIPEGTVRNHHTFTGSEWIPTDNFSSPIIADAIQVAQELNFYLSAAAQGRPEADRLKTSALSHDAAYRRRHGEYPVSRLARLAREFELFHLLISHLKGGRLSLPEQEAVRLNIQGGTAMEVAAQLADMMSLTEANLVEYAGISAPEAQAILSDHFAFTGDHWTEPGLYYWGHALERREQALKLAKNFTGYEQTALLKQADTFVSLVKPVKLEDIRLSPRDPVIPIGVLSSWINNYLGTELEDGTQLVRAEREKGKTSILHIGGLSDAGLKAAAAYDHGRAGALEAYLNHKTELNRIEGRKDMTREEQAAAEAAVMESAQAYEDEVQTHFTRWLSSSDHVREVEEAYTWTRGANLKPEGSKRPLDLPDWYGPAPHPYQAADVRVMAATTGMVNNYNVGLGKTYSALLLLAYLKRCGQARRPIISVPAGLVPNWAVNAARALPTWRVTVVGMTPVTDREGKPVYKRKSDGSLMVDDAGQPIQEWREDSAAVKKAKIAKLAAGQTDLIIMSREAYTDIGMFRSTRMKLIASDPQLQYQTATAEKYDRSGQMRRSARDQLIREIGVYASVLREVKVTGPGELSFEMLGCDFVAADEGHGLKNAYRSPKIFGKTPKYLGGTDNPSKRAVDALQKGRYIRSQGGKTYLFTASWVKNSPMEIYSMLSQVTDDLGKYGLHTQETLMEQYIRTEPDIFVDQSGQVSIEMCVAGFRRLQELKGIISSYVITRDYGEPDVVKSDGTPLDVPVAIAEEVMIDMTPEQTAVNNSLRTQARNASAQAKGDDHPFSIMWKMRKLAVDPALLGIEGRNPRFEKIAELVKQNRAEGRKAIVFLSIGEKEGSFERLKNLLIQSGYPADEIEIVSSNTHSSKVSRQDLEDRYNFGDISLILGTDVLGQGFNLQYGTGMIINADIPWNYEEIRQRTGRGARQGNKLKTLRNIYLLMRGSFDAMTYTIMSGKKAWQSELWGDQDELSNTAGGFSGEEMALLLSDDPAATKAAIDHNRKDLTARTRRAKLRRHMETLMVALAVKGGLLNTIGIANARKNGWTTHDHSIVIRKKATLRRAIMDVERIEDFPHGRLVNYLGDVEIYGDIALHVGAHYCDEEGERWTVLGYTKGLDTRVSVENTQGKCQTLSLQQLRSVDLMPSENPQHYGELNLDHGSTLCWGKQAKVYVLDPTQSPLKPKQEDNVLSFAISGDHTEVLQQPNTFLLKHLLSEGKVIVHILTHTAGAHLTVQGAVILSTSQKKRESFIKIKTDPKLHQKLSAIAAGALGADLISEEQTTLDFGKKVEGAA